MNHIKPIVQPLALALALLFCAPPVHAIPVHNIYKTILPQVRKAINWGKTNLSGYAAGELIDRVTGQNFEHQLQEHIPELVELIAKTTGPERELLQEQLDVLRDQLALLSDVLDLQTKDISQLQAEQERIQQQIDGFSKRLGQLEGRVEWLETSVDSLVQEVDSLRDDVDQLDSRLGRLEETMIASCLDRQYGEVVGAEGYRVAGAGRSLLFQHVDQSDFSLSLRLHLNACTGTLNERGLLIQLSLITRGLSEDLSMFATFKDLGGGYDPEFMNHLWRQEFLLTHPVSPWDGQVREFFVPYAEIPFSSHGDQIALALVVTHDGGPIFSLSDRVIHCVFGQRTNCTWRR